jgi:tetratricopeptide (TPR) repeat protein
MAKRRSARTIGKWLLAAALAVVTYPSLQYSAMLRDMDRARSLYAQGDLQTALGVYQRVEGRLRAHRAIRLIPAGDRQTLLLNQARLLYALNRYDDAIDQLQKEDEISGIATDGRFHLLRGNIAFRRTLQDFRRPRTADMDTSRSAGDLNILREGLIQAEDNFRQALELSSNDWDAKYNYELVDGMLKALRETVNENLKVLPEGELTPVSELPPDLVG